MKSVFLETYEISEKFGVLILNPKGDRPNGSEIKAHETIRQIKDQHQTDFMILDMREADYPLTQTQTALRAASFAREAKDFHLAIICRSDQGHLSEALSEAHTKLGALNKGFSSRGDAVKWLSGLPAIER